MSTVRPKITSGYRIGMLTVVEKTAERKGNYMVWKCRCDCGNEINLDTRCLQRGTVKDCGCVSHVRPGMVDLTGKRFGKLVCLKPCEEKNKRNQTQWICQCDCGNTCIAVTSQLTTGYKTSCGCVSHPALKDYVGKKFGMLTVTEYAGKERGMHRWKCVCDCGKETVVGQTLLQSGKTKSCGCYQVSHIVQTMDFVDGTSAKILKARMNRPPIASNKSGYNGVYKNAKGMWIAQICFKKKTYYLGSYTDIQDAVAARKQGEEMYENFLAWYESKHNNDLPKAVK